MPHPNGGQGTYFNPTHTFDQAFKCVADGYSHFHSTTGENLFARCGRAIDGFTSTIVFYGENSTRWGQKG
jgi:hypothetical protein